MSSTSGTLASIARRNCRNSQLRCRPIRLADDFADRDVQRREQRRRSWQQAVARASRGHTGANGSVGCVRSRV